MPQAVQNRKFPGKYLPAESRMKILYKARFFSSIVDPEKKVNRTGV